MEKLTSQMVWVAAIANHLSVSSEPQPRLLRPVIIHHVYQMYSNASQTEIKYQYDWGQQIKKVQTGVRKDSATNLALAFNCADR